jgi:LPPG:FO 2-phospho-L-lactate transferase
VLEAIAGADAVVLCPSNPVVSLGPILAVPGMRDAVTACRGRTVGVSGIVGGRPVAGMADKLMPAVGIEVSAAGVAAHYAELLSAWLVDDADAALVPRIRETGLRCRAVGTIMADDDRAEAVARAALELLA